MGSSHPNLGPRLVGVRASRRTKNSEGPQGREPGSVELAPYTHTRHAPAHTHAVTHPSTHPHSHTHTRARRGWPGREKGEDGILKREATPGWCASCRLKGGSKARGGRLGIRTRVASQIRADSKGIRVSRESHHVSRKRR